MHSGIRIQAEKQMKSVQNQLKIIDKSISHGKLEVSTDTDNESKS
jgi:hypothetical protein